MVLWAVLCLLPLCRLWCACVCLVGMTAVGWCAGRAGRDGKPARCMLLYRFSDALRQAAIVNFEPTWQVNLFAMMQYASKLSACRRAVLCR